MSSAAAGDDDAAPVWTPAGDGSTNVEAFMAAHDIADMATLRRASTQDPAWFWDAVVAFLGLPFATPYGEVLDTAEGIPWATWFTGGTTNLASICVERWAVETPDAEAVRWESEGGDLVVLTYAELAHAVAAAADGLATLGIGHGDAVGIFLPMLPQTVIAAMAVARLGAVFLPLFSGYGTEAVAVRLDDADARALICADGFWRRGEIVPMQKTAAAAADATESVEHLVVVAHLGDEQLSTTEGGTAISRFDAGYPVEATRRLPDPATPVDAEHPLVRRAIRATVLDTDPGDLSSLEDPGAIEAVRRAS